MCSASAVTDGRLLVHAHFPVWISASLSAFPGHYVRVLLAVVLSLRTASTRRLNYVYPVVSTSTIGVYAGRVCLLLLLVVVLCVCVCVRAYVRACVRACVRVCIDQKMALFPPIYFATRNVIGDYYRRLSGVRSFWLVIDGVI